MSARRFPGRTGDRVPPWTGRVMPGDGNQWVKRPPLPPRSLPPEPDEDEEETA